jgi:hypothetical protein
MKLLKEIFGQFKPTFISDYETTLENYDEEDLD